MSGWPADLDWLIGLCRYDLGGRPPAFDHVDAEAVSALAAAHRVAAIAQRGWRALAERGLAPPPPASLDERAARGRRRSLIAAAHLVRLARAFEAEGVQWLALKGPALSTQLYGDPAVRAFRDLDVIVLRAQFPEAIRAAAAAGWTAPADWEALLRITDRYDMELPPGLHGQPLLELHQTLGPRFVQFRLDPFGSPREFVTVAGAEVPTLAGPALVSYVAWHGARNLWFRLSWLMDWARLAPHGADEARDVVETARRSGVEIAVRAAALIAERLLDAQPPPWPPASARVARRAEQVAGCGLERLRIGIDSPRVRKRPGSYLWHWREVAQQDAAALATVGALRELARPTEADVRRLGVDLPSAIHHVARPYFLTARFLTDLAKGRAAPSD